MNINNLGQPTVQARAFVLLAIEAGIAETIKSLVPLATTKLELVVALKNALEGSNLPLALALNVDNLDAILDYMALTGTSPVVNKPPTFLDEAGPASVSAARDGGVSTQVNITFSAPQAGYTAEIYLDGVYMKDSTATPVEGWVNDSLSGVAAGSHTIRVLYRNDKGALTAFGPVAVIS